MKRIKSIEETVRNYAIGTIQGALKIRMHWSSKGFDYDRAVQNAVKYAIGQLESAGVQKRLDEYIMIFSEMKDICGSLVKMLREAKKREGETRYLYE